MTRQRTTPAEIKAALAMLKLGIASPVEIAAVAEVPRQNVWMWMRDKNINWQVARMTRLQKEWAKRLGGR